MSFKQFAARRKDNCESTRFRQLNPAISLGFKQLARRLHAAPTSSGRHAASLAAVALVRIS
ncbi:hypothetical protein AS156_34045 [Bradyrhizobium macuxiense]|uniref:Uncharacterized protein n=1 Tax=Bradyrhizobium macuxiense TaxID=1755647 RepID=A0A109K0V5_9BRAD|nr:hypothetical protein AS156_34045 [Bradyrhizobium macuxiense]